jgi:hypothetical protein
MGAFLTTIGTGVISAAHRVRRLIEAATAKTYGAARENGMRRITTHLSAARAARAVEVAMAALTPKTARSARACARGLALLALVWAVMGFQCAEPGAQGAGVDAGVESGLAGQPSKQP